MRKRIEEQCVKAICEFYDDKNYDFFDDIDDKVTYFSPDKNCIIQNKRELKNYFEELEKNHTFKTGNAKSKLVNLKPGVFIITTDLELKVIYKNGKDKLISQRITAAFRQTKHDDAMKDSCSYIQISNIMTQNEINGALSESDYESYSERETKKMIPLTGENGTVYYINANSVKFVESLKGVKCCIHTDNDAFITNCLIKDAAASLGDSFLRCHSGYAVNINKIKFISPYKITLTTGEEIPVPVKKYTSIKSAINEKLIF